MFGGVDDQGAADDHGAAEDAESGYAWAAKDRAHGDELAGGPNGGNGDGQQVQLVGGEEGSASRREIGAYRHVQSHDDLDQQTGDGEWPADPDAGVAGQRLGHVDGHDGKGDSNHRGRSCSLEAGQPGVVPELCGHGQWWAVSSAVLRL